jgi:hypothetical protein
MTSLFSRCWRTAQITQRHANQLLLQCDILDLHGTGMRCVAKEDLVAPDGRDKIGDQVDGALRVGMGDFVTAFPQEGASGAMLFAAEMPILRRDRLRILSCVERQRSHKRPRCAIVTDDEPYHLGNTNRQGALSPGRRIAPYRGLCWEAAGVGVVKRGQQGLL